MIKLRIEAGEIGLSAYEIISNAEGCVKDEKKADGYVVYFDTMEHAENAKKEFSQYESIMTIEEVDPFDTKMEERRRIGALLRNMANEKGMTFKEVGQITGIDPAVISRVAKGMYSTGVDLLAQISSAMGKQITFEDIKPTTRRCSKCKYFVIDEFGEMTCSVRIGRYKFVEADQCCERYEEK